MVAWRGSSWLTPIFPACAKGPVIAGLCQFHSAFTGLAEAVEVGECDEDRDDDQRYFADRDGAVVHRAPPVFSVTGLGHAMWNA